jgi:heme-degrading monooxygenase HmoA
MIAVIFEVWPQDGHRNEYLNIAATLRPMLAEIDGFISIERFESLSEPGKILSLSFWRDDKAIEKWRSFEVHRSAQAKGRAYVFQDYRLRVATVIRDYGMNDRDQAPADSRQALDATPLPLPPSSKQLRGLRKCAALVENLSLRAVGQRIALWFLNEAQIHGRKGAGALHKDSSVAPPGLAR